MPNKIQNNIKLIFSSDFCIEKSITYNLKKLYISNLVLFMLPIHLDQ